MDHKIHKNWMRLDNAALIYPATMNRNWTALFRVSAQLPDTIDPAILEIAQRRALSRFPSLACKLRRGTFWFYLERSDLYPKVQPDVGNPCARMRFSDNGGFALRVRYYEKRIAVEFFHVLTDGTGGFQFLKALVAEYITLRYGVKIPRGQNVFDCASAPDPAETEDSFTVHSGRYSASRREERAFRLTGEPEPDGFIHIITGIIPMDTLLSRAHEKGVSLNEYLTAVMLLSLDAIERRTVLSVERYRPVKVCVPIDLRRIFPSRTLRNFSNYVNPGIDPRFGTYTFDEVLNIVHHFMGMEVTKKLLNVKITTNVQTERNALLRVMPLFIKNAAMRLVYSQVGDAVSSTCLSNLGLAVLPPEMERFVTRLDLIIGPLAVNPVCAGVVGYNGKVNINFTRTITDPSLEREFFTRLVKLGIPVRIESNERD